jgi:hypothetical protein
VRGALGWVELEDRVADARRTLDALQTALHVGANPEVAVQEAARVRDAVMAGYEAWKHLEDGECAHATLARLRFDGHLMLGDYLGTGGPAMRNERWERRTWRCFTRYGRSQMHSIRSTDRSSRRGSVAGSHRISSGDA